MLNKRLINGPVATGIFLCTQTIRGHTHSSMIMFQDIEQSVDLNVNFRKGVGSRGTCPYNGADKEGHGEHEI